MADAAAEEPVGAGTVAALAAAAPVAAGDSAADVKRKHWIQRLIANGMKDDDNSSDDDSGQDSDNDSDVGVSTHRYGKRPSPVASAAATVSSAATDSELAAPIAPPMLQRRMSSRTLLAKATAVSTDAEPSLTSSSSMDKTTAKKKPKKPKDAPAKKPKKSKKKQKPEVVSESESGSSSDSSDSSGSSSSDDNNDKARGRSRSRHADASAHASSKHKHKHAKHRSSSSRSKSKTHKRKHKRHESGSPLREQRRRDSNARHCSKSSENAHVTETPSKPSPRLLVLTNEPPARSVVSDSGSASESSSSRGRDHHHRRDVTDRKREVASKERYDRLRVASLARAINPSDARITLCVSHDSSGNAVYALGPMRPSSAGRKRPLPGSSPTRVDAAAGVSDSKLAARASRADSTSELTARITSVTVASATTTTTAELRREPVTTDKRTKKLLTQEELDHRYALALASRKSERPRRRTSSDDVLDVAAVAAAAAGNRVASTGAADERLKKRKRVDAPVSDALPAATAVVAATPKVFKKPRRASIEAAGGVASAAAAAAAVTAKRKTDGVTPVKKLQRPVSAAGDAAVAAVASTVKSPVARLMLTPSVQTARSSDKKALSQRVDDASRAKLEPSQAKRESTGRSDATSEEPLAETATDSTATLNGHASGSADAVDENVEVVNTAKMLASAAVASSSADGTESAASRIDTADAPSVAAGLADQSMMASTPPQDDDTKEEGEEDEDEDGAVADEDGAVADEDSVESLSTITTTTTAASPEAAAPAPDLLSFVIPKRKIVRTDPPVAVVGTASSMALIASSSAALGGPTAMRRAPALSPLIRNGESNGSEIHVQPRCARRRTKNTVPLVKLPLTHDERDFVRLARRMNSFIEAAHRRHRSTTTSTATYSTRAAGPYDVVDANGAVMADLLPRMKCPTKKQLKTQSATYPPSFFGVAMTLATAAARDTKDHDGIANTVASHADDSVARYDAAATLADVLNVPIRSYEPLVFARREDRELYQRKMYGTAFVPQMLRVCTTLIARNVRYERKTTGFVFNADRDREDFAKELGERYAMNASVPRGDIPLKHWQLLQKQQPALVYLHYMNSEDAELAAQRYVDDYGAPLERKRTNKVGGAVSSAVVAIGAGAAMGHQQQQAVPRRSRSRERSVSTASPAVGSMSADSVGCEPRPSDAGAWQPYHDEPRLAERNSGRGARDWPLRFQNRSAPVDQMRGRDRRPLDRYGGNSRNIRSGPDPAYRYGGQPPPPADEAGGGGGGGMRDDRWRERDDNGQSQSRTRGESQPEGAPPSHPPLPPSTAPSQSGLVFEPGENYRLSGSDNKDDKDVSASRDGDRDGSDVQSASSAADEASSSQQAPASQTHAPQDASAAALSATDDALREADASKLQDTARECTRSASLGKENCEQRPSDVGDRPRHPQPPNHNDHIELARSDSRRLDRSEMERDIRASHPPRSPPRGGGYENMRQDREHQSRERDWPPDRRDFDGNRGDDRRRDSGKHMHAPRDFDSRGRHAEHGSGGGGTGGFGFDGRERFERRRSRSFGRSDRLEPHGRDHRGGPPPHHERTFNRRDDAHFHGGDRDDRERYGSSNGHHHPPPMPPHDRRHSPPRGPPQFPHGRSEHPDRERGFRRYGSRDGGRPPQRYGPH